LLLAAGDSAPLLLLGIALFGVGIGNTTSLPPLIAQAEFLEKDALRVVPLIVAISQTAYSFGPAAFKLIRELAPHAGAPRAAPVLFGVAALIQALAIAAFLLGRGRG